VSEQPWIAQVTLALRRRAGALYRRGRRRVEIAVGRHRFYTAQLRDWPADRRHGGWCGGGLEACGPAGATRPSSVHYWELDRIFANKGLEITADDVLVDVGCGKGRVINWWLDNSPARRIVGVEIEPSLAAATARRLSAEPRVTVVAGDASEQLPPDGTMFWLFNPFTIADEGRRMMIQLRQALDALPPGSRGVRVVLFRDRHREVFEGGGWEIHRLPTRVYYPLSVVVVPS